MKVNYYLLIFIMLFVFILNSKCAKQIELSSKWRDSEIFIDGIDNEWGSATIYVAKAKVSITLINDNQDLYIRLCSRDRQVHAQVLGMGLTIWFDPDGGKEKTLGIRFPLGMKDTPMMTRTREGDQGERLQKMLEESTNELEILRSDGEEINRILLTEAKTHGIDVKMGFSRGNLVYELKVPLIQDEEHLYAIDIDTPEADAGPLIGIGFETPEFSMKEMREKMEEGGTGMPGEGPPPGGDRMPGGVRGGGPPGGIDKAERLNLWTKVQLASMPSVQD